MWTRRKTLGAGLGTAAWPVLGSAAPGSAPSPATSPTPSPAAADAPPPVQAFFGPPVLAGAVLSPDGSKVAMRVAARDSGRIRLAVLDLKTMASAAIAAITDSDIERLDWVGDGQLVFDTSQQLVEYGRADFGPGLFAVDVRGESLRELVSTRGQPADGLPRTLLHWAYELYPLTARPDGDEVLLVRPEEMRAQRIGHYSLRWLDITRRTRGGGRCSCAIRGPARCPSARWPRTRSSTSTRSCWSARGGSSACATRSTPRSPSGSTRGCRPCRRRSTSGCRTP